MESSNIIVLNYEDKYSFLCVAEEQDGELVDYCFRCCKTGRIFWVSGGSGQFDIGKVYSEERVRKYPLSSRVTL